jgi:hemerythrin
MLQSAIVLLFPDQFIYFQGDHSSEHLALRMYKELTDWLVNHIKKVDENLKACVHE